MTRWAACLLLLIAAAPTLGAQLNPIFDGNRIGIELSGLQLPKELEKELKSGLTNRLLMRVSLLAGTQRREHAIEIAAKYDLWDENFTVTISIDSKVVTLRTETSSAALLQLFANPRVTSVFASTEVPTVGELQLRVEALLNPIDRERMEQIRRWVAENSVSAAQDDPGSPGRPAVAPIVNSIFNRIFEQFSAGGDLAGAWHQTVSSHAFPRRDLEP